ncbi:MAG: DUF6391 domain-containing protein [Cyanobacteria bacterium P01_A01_bin.45]
MNTSVNNKSGLSVLDFLNFDSTFDLTVPQPNLDTDLLEQLYFIPGLKEVLLLRQVHALEHATIWLVSKSNGVHNPGKYIDDIQEKFPVYQFSNNTQENSSGNDNQLLGGLSTEKGFYVYGDVNISNLRRAANIALHRLTHGDWDLAVHPRCGTNLSVSMILTAALALGINLFLPRGPVEQFFGLGLAATTASELTPDVGAFVQRYITTAIPFNLVIENVTPVKDNLGRKAHFVKVKWH